MRRRRPVVLAMMSVGWACLYVSGTSPPAPAPHKTVVIAKEARPPLSTAHIPFRADCGDQPISAPLHFDDVPSAVQMGRLAARHLKPDT